MKLATILTILILLLLPFETASAKKLAKDEIRLNADQVSGANDIEAAIITATSQGTQPGTVVLDGSNGPFVFTAPDRSLNIFLSSITIRGENNAVIANCDDGLFFEGASTHSILVEKVIFNCTGDGVEATGEFHDVTLRNNTINAAYFGIVASGASSGWLITDNQIKSGWDGIRMTGSKNVEITKNDITGPSGVIVLTGSGFEIKSNTIHANQGILLGQEAWNNIVQANHIDNVILSGVALEPGVSGNRILANRVTCIPGTACVVFDLSSAAANSNKVEGNKVK